MPERETRMSRLHRRSGNAISRDRQDNQSDLDFNEQTMLYNRQELQAQWEHERTANREGAIRYDEVEWENSQDVGFNDSLSDYGDYYDQPHYEERMNYTAEQEWSPSANDSMSDASYQAIEQSFQHPPVRPYSRRIDRFLNNALILVTVLLLVVLVIMFIL